MATQQEDGNKRMAKYCSVFIITVSTEVFARVFFFRETSQVRSFVKFKPSRNDEITLSFIDAGKSGPSQEILKPQICILTDINFSQKFPDLQ